MPGSRHGLLRADRVEGVAQIGVELFDYILVNSAQIPPAALEQYREKQAAPVLADLWNLQNMGLHVIARNFLHYSIYARHDAKRISEQILALLGRDPNKLRR